MNTILWALQVVLAVKFASAAYNAANRVVEGYTVNPFPFSVQVSAKF